MTQNVAQHVSTERLAVANFRAAKHYGKSKFVLTTCTQNERGNIKVKDRIISPRFNMAVIPDHKIPRFHQEDLDKNLYELCLSTKEGREIVSALRNARMDAVINECVKKVEETIGVDVNKVAQGHTAFLKHFLSHFEHVPLEGDIDVDDKVIGLTMEEIWLNFKSKGLVEKVKSLKQ